MPGICTSETKHNYVKPFRPHIIGGARSKGLKGAHGTHAVRCSVDSTPRTFNVKLTKSHASTDFTGHQLKPVRAFPNPPISETCWKVLVVCSDPPTMLSFFNLFVYPPGWAVDRGRPLTSLPRACNLRVRSVRHLATQTPNFNDPTQPQGRYTYTPNHSYTDTSRGFFRHHPA